MLTKRRESENPTTVPLWARDAIFYQIFPERFANGNPSNDPPEAKAWGSLPTGKTFFGGDLEGIINHLDHLQDLRINAIYLNPIFISTSNHKYNTSDYLKIDPAFGDNQLFKNFVDTCHGKNIRIVIDGVFNHTGTAHWAFQDIVANGERSKYAHWYNCYSFPVASPRTPNYECWWNHGGLPKLMIQHPDVKKHIFEVTRYWTEYGIDGWRLDVSNEIPHEFWKEWRKLVKSINPDCYIVGEIWDPASEWLHGDEFDGVMNYQFRSAVIDYFCKRTIPTAEFIRRLDLVRKTYSFEHHLSLQNLIGSHDTERFFSLCKRDLNKMKLSILFQMTYVGAPMIYYGDEIGMEGGTDPDCRRTMEWDSSKWNSELYSYYKKLVAIRNYSDALRRGDFEIINLDKSIFAFRRVFGNTSTIVVINNNRESAKKDIPVSSDDHKAREMIGNEDTAISNSHLTTTINPYSGKIFEISKEG